MFHWEKLSPDEFKTFQEYISESNKNLIDAVKEYLGNDEDPKKETLVDFPGFSRFMSIYMETCIPEDLCRHLFVSFLKKPHPSCPKNHGFLSRSDSNSLAPDKSTRKGLHSPSSSISEPTELRLMSNFVERRKSLLRRRSADGTTGFISLKDFMCCLSLLEAGEPENKLEFLFRLYDTDGNGILDSIEIETIISQMMTVARYSGWDVSELKPILQEMMQEVDSNADGCVTLEEWMKAGSSNIPLMVLLGVDSVFTEENLHSWELKHFNRPAFCNHCLNLLVGLGKQGLRCVYCKYTVHERCVQRMKQPCIATYSKSKIVQLMTHHWVDGNCTGKCDKCKKYIKAYNRLTGKKCRWCKISVHNRCAAQVDLECNMGSCKQHILSPSQISPAVLNRKLKSKSPTIEPSNSIVSLEDSINSSFSSLQLVPLPDVTPVLVFINPKSGGKQGKGLLKKFQYILNPRQVFNITAENGFMAGLQFFRELPDYRVLCCGGDGTVGWLLESMDKMNYTRWRPPVAILPLGTGNDLARSLRWGGGYEGENLYKILDQIGQSSIVMMDRWHIEIKNTSLSLSTNEHSKVPCNIINNYFSIGVDASIAHRFHVMREKHPEKFNSRMKNKLIYLEYGTSETLRATCKNLHESVQITCDGFPLDLIRGPSMEGVAMLNIPSIYGGSNLWGDTMKIKKRKKVIGDVEKECSSGSMSSTDLSLTIQDMGDKLIEIVGLMNTMHMVKVKGGIHSGERLAQCSTLTIQTLKEFPMQIDGEPWIQPPCTLIIRHENQVPVLMAPHSSRKLPFFNLFSSK